MGSESKYRNDGGDEAAAKGLPPTAKKVVQSVKEIVNCTEHEIYAVLKECDMDPNRAVERLLAQDTFHEVRSKRERKKEMKEASDSRPRGNSFGTSRGGGKFGIGGERRVLQSGLAHATYNEHCKGVGKGGEVGSGCASVTSSATTRVVAKSSKNDSSSTENGRQSLGTGDSMPDSAQIPLGSQPLLIGVNKGHLSMADVVRMGRASQDSVSHNHYNSSGVSASGNSESSLSLHHQNNSEQQVLHDDWPLIEQPTEGSLQGLHMYATSNANGSFEHPNLHTEVSLRRNCEVDAAQVSLGNVASDNANSEKGESAFISSKHTITSSNTGLGPRSNSSLKNTCTSDFHSSHEHHEDVSSVAWDFQRLSMRESEMELPSSEDNSTLVLPNDFQPWAAECSHLSFGTYNGGSNSASPAHLASNHLSRSGLEEEFATIDDSLTQFLDANSAYDSDNQLGFDVLRGTAGDQNYDFLSSSRQELLKNTPEETRGHEYSTIASRSDPSFQNSHWVTPSLPLKQSGLQSGSHPPFPRELHADSNSIPDDVLAFLISQSQRARYSNAESSVIEPGSLALNRSALPQDLTVQSSVHFQQLPDTKRYGSLPQNQSYMGTINAQQAVLSNAAYIQSPGNTAYIQSPAHMKHSLPQNRNEFHMSRLPPATASDAFGYGNLGSSFYGNGSFLSNQSPGYMKPSSNFDEILPSQYNGGRNLSTIQQHGDFSQWDYGAETRSSFLPEQSQYNFLGQPSQGSLSQYVSPGYSDLQHSRARALEELQQQGDLHELSKQLYQFRQHSH